MQSYTIHSVPFLLIHPVPSSCCTACSCDGRDTSICLQVHSHSDTTPLRNSVHCSPFICSAGLWAQPIECCVAYTIACINVTLFSLRNALSNSLYVPRRNIGCITNTDVSTYHPDCTKYAPQCVCIYHVCTCTCYSVLSLFLRVPTGS